MEIKKYVEIALRRKYWIVIAFMIVLLVGFAYLLGAPRIYESTTLILVQGQKVPEEFVRSIVSTDAEDRLRTISQQVTSRTNLEKIIADNKLYDDATEMLLEEKVTKLRDNINIDVAARSGRGGNAFSISFQGKEPRKVMQVTNDLASNFISENIKIRESQAMGTSMFLADELEERRQELQEKEEQLKNYKEKYRGGLPEQLDTNLRIIERLQTQLDQLNSNLRDAENRKIILQQGISSNISGAPNRSGSLISAPMNELESLKSQLEILQSKYTDKHPDIISIKKRIAALETSEAASGEEETEGSSKTEQEREPVNVNQAVRLQLKDIQLEIATIREEIEEVNGKIKWYDAKVEETPKREQELLSLNRDYSSLRERYESMLNTKYAAEMSVSMERKQKGENFNVIDPAQIPLKPVKPNVKKLLILIIGLGLGLGGGIAYLMEMLDTSYRVPDDAEKELGLPVLVCLPYLYTQQELSARRRRRILIASSMAVSYCIAIVGVVMLIKGYSETIEFIKEIFTKIGIA
ncbi:MAG: GNVR domain-containing protein [Desulfobacteraceae bacterium]